MKESVVKKFMCSDCGRKVECVPSLVLRQSRHGPGVVRVNVCRRCHTGQKPEKRRSK
jgi:hypothetical protein